MSLTIYGSSHSRSLRVLWMATELGLEFTHQPLDWQSCSTDAAYLAINPAGTIPAIDDDGFVLAESLAINCYLARKAKQYWPASDEAQAQTLQWTLFAASTLEAPYLRWASNTLWLPEAKRDPAEAAAGWHALQRHLAHLEHALQTSDHLLGNDFGVADLNVASVVNSLRRADLSTWPHFAAWLERCLSRPAYRIAAKLP